MPLVFISHRRRDAAWMSGVYFALVGRFGDEEVFIDEDIAPGADFEAAIRETITECQALVALIGPLWMSVDP
jgi:hypothetical protein